MELGTTHFLLFHTCTLISLIPRAIAYYLPGLHKGVDHFIYFAAVLFVCMMLVESLMMIVASVVPNFLMGMITDSGIQGLMILTGGFFRLRNDVPNSRAHKFLMGWQRATPKWLQPTSKGGSRLPPPKWQPPQVGGGSQTLFFFFLRFF
jgi:hypothetical protein